MADDGGPLPPGWDRKYDHRTGRYYYINYFNKTTTWEDPRSRYRQLNQVTPQHIPAPTMVENIPLQEVTTVRPSPIPGRVIGLGRGTPYSSPVRNANTMETSMSTDTEVVAAKIGAMFPTVSDTHIRTLLMKYLKSVFPKVEETLLLDILSDSENNVQKATDKLLTMGFEKRDTPPPRLTLRKTEEPATIRVQPPVLPTPPPRMKSLEEKQKMKVRLQEYHRDIPERVIAIALDSVDYDEERASQILQFMVQEEQRSKSALSRSIESYIDKTAMVFIHLIILIMYCYNVISSTFPFSSLQKESGASTSRSECTAATNEAKIMSSTVTYTTSRKGESPAHKKTNSSPAHIVVAQKISPITAVCDTKRSKHKKDVSKMSRGTCTGEDTEYQSPYLIKASGPNSNLHQGANDDLLLMDYVAWSGPNPDLLQTASSPRVSLAKGPNPLLLGERKYKPHGPNAELRKGPLVGLAKGSIYSQLTVSAADHVSEESRGK